MRFNLPVKFIVLEQNRVVVAKFDIDQVDNFFNTSGYIADHCARQIRGIRLWVDDMFLKEFSARAICSPEDKFDVEKGKKIAKTKLMIKFYKKFVGCIAKEIHENLKIQNELLRFENELGTKIGNANLKLARIVEED